MRIEDPDADSVEQMMPVTSESPENGADDDGIDDLSGAELPLDADPLDVADQHRSVPMDDDDADY